MTMIPSNECKQAARVSAYFDGELAPELRAPLEAHLAACSACQAELESLRRLSGRLQTIKFPAATGAMSARLRARLEAQEETGLLHAAQAMMGIAAALMIAALVGLRMLGSSGTVAAAPNPDWAVAAQHPVPEVAGGGQEMVLAQWMVDDLSMGDSR
jgi:anti-sigma factor RsiW